MEFSSGWIRACVWLSGGWIIFLRDKEQGKNLEGYCQKLMVGTWVGGGIATVSHLSPRELFQLTLGVCRAEHVSGKGCGISGLPWDFGAWSGLKWWVLALYGGRGENMQDMILRQVFYLFLSRSHWVVSSQPKSYEIDVFPVRIHRNASL